jgi:hypothetical protein
VNARPAPAEWSGGQYGLPFPDGTPLMLQGQLLAGSRDASLRLQWGSFPALHIIAASGGYPAAACDRRILIDATAVIKAAEVRPGGRCRRPACASLFATAEPAAPAPPAATPGPSVFRCTECGHGRSLRAWAHVNIHGDLAPDGNIEWPNHEDDAFWPVIEDSVTCKLHGEDHIEKLVDGQYTSHIDTATGRYAAAPAASPGGGR